MVLCGLPALALRPQLFLRRRPVGLFEPGGPVAVPLLAQRPEPGHSPLAAPRRVRRHGLLPPGAVVGQLDGPVTAVTSRVLGVAAIALVAAAHVGSPDTFFEGAAGPYPVRVIVKSPGVVPGLAQITVRVLTPANVRRVLVLPVYWDPRTAAPPPPDIAAHVPGDSTLYDAALWLMTGGSYSVQVTVEGDAGVGTAQVPVMAVATRRLALQWSLGAGLLAFGVFLCVGAVTLVGAAVRESGLEPGAAPDRRRTRRARIAMVVSVAVLAGALLGGRAWWNAVDAQYRSGLYQALHATATVRVAGGGRVLRLAIDDTSWTNPRRQWTPLVPDHGHLMHLFLVRDSSVSAFAHLHPLPLDSTTFEAALPPLQAGTYRGYAEIVHESGFAETLVARVDIGTPAGAWRPSDPDDAWTTSDGQRATGNVASLPDGAVFVHLHPAGSISLAALETFAMRQPGDTIRGRLSARITALEKGSGEWGVVPPAAQGRVSAHREGPLPTPHDLSFRSER